MSQWQCDVPVIKEQCSMKYTLLECEFIGTPLWQCDVPEIIERRMENQQE